MVNHTYLSDLNSLLAGFRRFKRLIWLVTWFGVLMHAWHSNSKVTALIITHHNYAQTVAATRSSALDDISMRKTADES
jgi:hypothetical protein